MFVAIMCLGLVSIPKAFSQANTNVTVLSYSWYINPAGHLVAVGEVQNTGNYVLQSVSLNAAVYTTNETELVSSSAMAIVNYLLPQQKAPFYVDFGSSNTTGIDVASSVGSIEFTITNAPPTNSNSIREYADLNASVDYNGSLDGAFAVGGLIRNTGDQTANNIGIVGTYYNSSGSVVAVGFNNVTSSLIPENATSFLVTELEATPSIVAQISKFSLLVQTSTLESTSSTSTSTGAPGTGGSFPIIYYYVIGVGTVVAVIVIAITLLMFRKRKVASPPPMPPPPPPPPE